MSSTEESKIRRYKAFLIALWNRIHTTTYGTDYNLSNDQLFTITPEHVCRFLCFKAYGTESPNFATDKPTHGRSSSLEFAKKAISYFMPNRLLAWNEQTRSGNPTRSTLVKNIIKRVKRTKWESRASLQMLDVLWSCKSLWRSLHVSDVKDNSLYATLLQPTLCSSFIW